MDKSRALLTVRVGDWARIWEKGADADNSAWLLTG